MVQRIAGVDEAGRGPVIGPLIITAIVIEEPQEDALIEWGVRDSKKLSPRQRESLANRIRRLTPKIEVLEISAKEIDSQRRLKRSLNTLEAQWMAQVLQKLEWDTAFVDASDVNAERYGRYIMSHLHTDRKVISEHKADRTYPIVAAASIIAKVHRDQCIQELHQTYGDFGSGYPNDPKTRQFLKNWLKEHDTFPDIVRQTWETARNLLSKKRQPTLK